MSYEEPTKCPDCGQMSCYSYTGMQVCQDCYEKTCRILDMREWMKRITFTAKTEEHQKNADMMNELVPAIVERISDEEILEALNSVEEGSCDTQSKET